MRTLLLTVAIVLGAVAWPAAACDDHAPGNEPAQRKGVKNPSVVSGTVREVDVEENAVTLKHGRIASLRMQAMSSMRFKASDPSLLAGLAPGDKVRFRATIVGSQPTLVEIVRLK